MLSAILLLSPLSISASQTPTVDTHTENVVESAITAKPAPKPDFDKEVLEPLRQKQAEVARIAQEAAEAQAKAEAEAQARQAELDAQAQWNYVPPAPQSYGGLVGSIGYANPNGNCVNEPGVNNPGYGNPSSWPATSFSPWIGATALFTYNHVGVVVGIWGNGDLEIRHQNFRGGIHRFPRSQFRGFR